MEDFAKALNYAVPAFTLLILIELAFAYVLKKDIANIPDLVSSISSGITNITKDVLGLVITIISYQWLEENYAVFDLQVSWWMFPVVFVAKDFWGYWIHRFEHKINYFWNRHMIHHSSEEFNLPCALRQSISTIINFTIFFAFPLALLGIPTTVFAIVAPIHLFAQFWYHTRLIDRMGFLEHLIVTPSHHRVHHAINELYLDKNFGQIFIVWDKWFGTFQEEQLDLPPVYGVKKPVATWNPILINFQHAGRVWLDFFRTANWIDKGKIWFMPTGWRPADVALKYPIEIIEDPYAQIKYMPKIKNWVKVWSFFQLIVTLLTAMFLFNNLAHFDFEFALIIGAFVFLAVYSYTTIMDGKRLGGYLEIAKSIVGLLGILIVVQYLPSLSILEVSFLNAALVYHALCIALAVGYIKDAPAVAQQA